MIAHVSEAADQQVGAGVYLDSNALLGQLFSNRGLKPVHDFNFFLRFDKDELSPGLKNSRIRQVCRKQGSRTALFLDAAIGKADSGKTRRLMQILNKFIKRARGPFRFIRDNIAEH